MSERLDGYMAEHAICGVNCGTCRVLANRDERIEALEIQLSELQDEHKGARQPASSIERLLAAKEVGGEFVDEREVHHGPLEDYLAVLLGLCGCCDVGILELALKALSALDGPNDGRYFAGLPNDAIHEAFLHLLDHRGLLEHGGSVRFSWLTPEGEKVLELLRRWDKERRAAQPS